MGCFQGQVAVVTGASSGIGRAIALDFAGHGAEVCLVARREDLLKSVAQEAAAMGGLAHVHATDLTSDEAIQLLAANIQKNFAHVNLLVLCGGAISHSTTEQGRVEDFDLQYRSNLRAPYALVQVLLPLLRRQQGQIVFINSSVATRQSGKGVGQFTATQHALRAIADSLRDEVNADGIRVLSVYPGRTATERMAKLAEQEGRAYLPELLIQPQDLATMVSQALCLPRTVEVTDIRMRPMKKSY